MLGVYNYMAMGIAVTAVLILASFTIPAFRRRDPGPGLPGHDRGSRAWLVRTRLVFGGSVVRAHGVFWAYVAAWGIGIAPIVNRYLGIDPSMVMSAFLTTAITFGAMSVWGYTTKKDLSGMANTVA